MNAYGLQLHARFVIPDIYFRLKGNISHHIFKHIRQQIRIVPHQSAIGIVALIQHKLQMITLLAHSALIVQQRLTEGKYRCLIFAAAGLQQCQLLQIPDADFAAAAQNTVNRLMRQIILRTQLLRNVFTEAALEFRQQLCRQRQARSLMVTAVLRQQITFGIYRLVKIERRNTAAAALGNAVVQAYQNRRQVVLVYQARSYDTDNALMPAFGSKHDCRIDMLFLRQLCFRLFHNLTADFLTQCVFTVKLGGNLLRLNAVVGYQKLHRQLRMLQPAHGVQARCQTKADVIGSNARFRTAAGLNQSTQSHQLRCFHCLQATAHQLAVFANQRHNIRHRSQRRQLCKSLPLRQSARLTLL